MKPLTIGTRVLRYAKKPVTLLLASALSMGLLCLAAPGTAFATENEYTIKPFTICREGNNINGKCYMPAVVENGSVPAVIIGHEFGTNMAASAPYAQGLSSAGYAVFVFDFCGSCGGSSEGASTEMSVLTEKDDMSAVLDFAQRYPGVDAGKITLMGCSQGGMVAALLAAERQDEITGLMMMYPALSIPDDARKGSMLGAKFDPDNIPDTFNVFTIKLGRRYVEDALSLDPWKEICVFTKPVLIVHGTSDFVVSIEYSRKAAEVYESCTLLELTGAGHGFVSANFTKALNAAKDFLAE